MSLSKNSKTSFSTSLAKTPPCAGIIVFDDNNTVLVSTDRGNMSFPKGKCNKAETYINTAWRELEEETGLNCTKVQLIADDIYIDELSSKGNPSVRYFVGKLLDEHKTFTFDKTELANVAWCNVLDALNFEKLKPERKAILGYAYKIYKNSFI